MAAQKRRELQEYVRVAFVQGNISLDASNVHLSGQINVDTISDAIVTDGILRAQQRYDRLLSQSTELPTHVTISEAPAVDDQETATFFNQVKEFGARAFRAITLHSGEILLKDDLATRPLPTTKVEAVPAGSSR